MLRGYKNEKNNTNSQDDYTNACYYLALLEYENLNTRFAENVLSDCLKNPELNNQNKYWLLSYLSTIYQETNDTENYKKTLEEIVALPDDMYLWYEDWPSIRSQLKIELGGIS